MPLFFENEYDLHLFTIQLSLHKDQLICKNCLAHHEFKSHGFVYKKDYQGQRRVVGKRLFCSNRGSHHGCGATQRLYLSEQVPHLQYNAIQLYVFLLSLTACMTIQQAYYNATSCTEPRNAYRWLIKIQNKLIEYRTAIMRFGAKMYSTVTAKTKRLAILISTLKNLFDIIPFSSCALYQQTAKNCFI